MNFTGIWAEKYFFLPVTVKLIRYLQYDILIFKNSNVISGKFVIKKY